MTVSMMSNDKTTENEERQGKTSQIERVINQFCTNLTAKAKAKNPRLKRVKG